MMRHFLRWLLCLAVLLPTSVRAEHKLVLVASEASPIKTLDSLDLRKIYFGIDVWENNQSINGLRNLADEQIDRVFLQSVVAMTSDAYHRRLLSMTLKTGHPRQREFTRLNELVDALHSDVYAVSYVWAEEAEKFPKLKVLKVLWQGN